MYMGGWLDGFLESLEVFAGVLNGSRDEGEGLDGFVEEFSGFVSIAETDEPDGHVDRGVSVEDERLMGLYALGCAVKCVDEFVVFLFHRIPPA